MTDLARYYDQSVPPAVLVPPVAPTLTTLVPSSIVVDTPTLVTITGTDFRMDSHVYVDGVRQHSTYVNATTITYMGQADQVGSQDVLVATAGLPSTSLPLTVTATAEELEVAPTMASTKAEIIGWILDHDETATEEQLTPLTKADLLVEANDLLTADEPATEG